MKKPHIVRKEHGQNTNFYVDTRFTKFIIEREEAHRKERDRERERERARERERERERDRERERESVLRAIKWKIERNKVARV